jgi:hypothetical protein
MLDLIYGPRATHSLASSALPGAPVIREDARRPPRTRSAAAALLRRAADRLAPDPRELIAS